MQPSRQFDGVQISSKRTEAFHRFQNGSDVIKSMVEAGWTGILLENILEHRVGQSRGHCPGSEEVLPFSVRNAVH